MSRPHVYRTEAVVLRQRRIGDADKICVLFTPKYGRIEAIAKGVRRPRSRLAGHVEPLTKTTLLIASGRTLDIITQAQSITSYPNIHGDIDRLSRALYVSEMIDRFTDTVDDVESLYSLLIHTLERISSTRNVDLPIRWFEMQMLIDQGYHPELMKCVHCQIALGLSGNAFSAQSGGVLCSTCRSKFPGRPLSDSAFKLLRFLQSPSYSDVQRFRVDESLQREIELHLRSAIHQVIERDVFTGKFIDTIRLIQKPQDSAKTASF